MYDVDWGLASWAAHEGKCDPQGRPLVLKELQDAACMKNMSAIELDGRLFSNFTGVADCAELVLRR